MPTENTAGTETEMHTPWHVHEDTIEDDRNAVVASGLSDARARRIVASVNALCDLTVEAIEKIEPMDFAQWKVLAARVAELEATIRDLIEHTKTCGYDCEQTALEDSVRRARAALAPAVPATNAKEGE